MIVSAEDAAQLVGRHIADGGEAIVVCPVGDSRWHVATVTPEGLQTAARVMADTATACDADDRTPGRLSSLADVLYPIA